MHGKIMIGAAALALLSTPAFAQEASDHEGFSLAIGAAQFEGDVTFTGGKPTEELSGTLATARIGYDHQFGDHLVLGASYWSSLGDGLQSGPIRDGNYLVQDARLDGLSGWEVRAGWAFGDFMPYVGYGETERDLAVRQSCPNDPASVVAGFCAGAAATARAGQREGDAGASAETISLGLEWNATEHVFIDVRWSQADYGTQLVSLDPTGNTPGQTAHPLTNPSQEPSWIAIQIGARF